MKDFDILSAIRDRSAKHRRLGDGLHLLHVPDAAFSAIIRDTDAPGLDFSRCGRMSKFSAHRVVKFIKDASPELVRAIHRRIDGHRGEAAP